MRIRDAAGPALEILLAHVIEHANRVAVFSFFAQDTWKATSSLTVNYGMRYEYYPIPVSDHFGMVRYDPTTQSTITDANGTHLVGNVLLGGLGGLPASTGINNNHGTLVPRVGISYRLNPKTVIRSGFGLTVDPDNFRSNLPSYPQTISSVVNGANSFIAAGTVAAGIPALTIPDTSSGRLPLPSTISKYTVPADFRRGYVESYNLSLQHEFPLQLSATVAYVGSHAIRQQTPVNLNSSAPGGGAAGSQLNVKYGASFNNTDILQITPFRGSVYNSLQTQLTRAAGRLGQFGIIYTFSKAMNASDNGSLGTLTFDYPTFQDRNWALAGYDRKHNFQAYSVFTSPFGNRHGISGALAGGWQLSSILSRVSGTPFTVSAAGTSLNAPGNSQVADYNVEVPAVLSGNTNGLRQYLNPAAYSAVTAVRFGTSSRNSVRGSGLSIWT